MLSLGVEFRILIIILLIHIGNASGREDDYWTDDFDQSKDCTNKGRSKKCLIASIVLNPHQI